MQDFKIEKYSVYVTSSTDFFCSVICCDSPGVLAIRNDDMNCLMGRR